MADTEPGARCRCDPRVDHTQFYTQDGSSDEKPGGDGRYTGRKTSGTAAVQCCQVVWSVRALKTVVTLGPTCNEFGYDSFTLTETDSGSDSKPYGYIAPCITCSHCTD